MLNEEIERYAKLTGKEYDVVNNTPVCAIGSYLDGYEKCIDDFTKYIKIRILNEIDEVHEGQMIYEVGSEMSKTYSTIIGTLRDVYTRIVDDVAEQLKGREQ